MFAASETIDVTDAKNLPLISVLVTVNTHMSRNPWKGSNKNRSLVSLLACGANIVLTSRPSIG